MRSTYTSALVALASAGLASAQSWSTITPIEAYGQHYFYKNNGSQFFIKGVAYQQGYEPNGASNPNVTYTDPLIDASACQRDIPNMVKIFTNTIRVYAIDPTKNHDDCMAQLASAGIYVFADLSEPENSIQTDDPTWNVPLYERYTSVVDALAKYNNVIGFFAGNEVVNKANQTTAAAFVKAAIRDTKQYIKSKNYRTSLGVGYATSDVDTRNQLASYFVCAEQDSWIDFWGYNVYSWCGDSSYTQSQYDQRVDFFRDYPVPVFFAEYGCNQGLPGGEYSRPFEEVAALFGPMMTPVFSGGIVFEYFNGANGFGLFELKGNTVSAYPDYTSLSSQLAKVSPTPTQRSAYTPTNSGQSCPALGASWSATATPLPPSVNTQLCDCEASTFQCAVSSDNATAYGEAFNYICGADNSACDAFVHNATTGKYGSLSGCSPKVQLGWAANQYFIGQKSNPSACDFGGVASTQAASTASSCTALIKAASSGNVPSPTAGSSGSSGGGNGGSTTSKGLARLSVGSPHSASEFGFMYMAAYAGLALISGMGMLLL